MSSTLSSAFGLMFAFGVVAVLLGDEGNSRALVSGVVFTLVLTGVLGVDGGVAVGMAGRRDSLAQSWAFSFSFSSISFCKTTSFSSFPCTTD